MNSENESTFTFQSCSNFAKKYWKLLIVLSTAVSFAAGIATRIASTAYWVGKNDTERKHSREKIKELQEKVTQQENDIKISNKESQKKLMKNTATIKKLKKELSIEHRQIILDCYKNIDTHIKKLEEEKRKTKGLGFEPFTFTELTEKQAREAKEKARMIDKLDARIDTFIEQSKGCNN